MKDPSRPTLIDQQLVVGQPTHPGFWNTAVDLNAYHFPQGCLCVKKIEESFMNPPSLSYPPKFYMSREKKQF